jgi:hypothetical protein
MAEGSDRSKDAPKTLRSPNDRPSTSGAARHSSDPPETPTSVLSIVNAQAPSYGEAPAAGGTSPATREPPTKNPFEEAHAAVTVRRHLPEELRRRAAGLEPDVPTLEAEMADCLALGDYSGALSHAERILEEFPGYARAMEVSNTCRDVLRKMYESRIGAHSQVPVLLLSQDELRWLTIDHKAGFILSLVDGNSSVETIIDASGMTELDALRLLSELVQQRIIRFR